MKILNDNFENLFFTSNLIDIVKIDECDIVLRVEDVRKIGFINSIELNEKLYGRIFFKNVFYSRRSITEYIGDPKGPVGFKDTYEIEDNFYTSSGDVRKYEFEGVLLNPPAWIGFWSIQAGSFEFHIEKDV